MTFKGVVMLAVSLAVLDGCSARSFFENAAVSKAHVTDRTRASEILMALTAPVQPVPVVVYDFQDQTGQFKNNENY